MKFVTPTKMSSSPFHFGGLLLGMALAVGLAGCGSSPSTDSVGVKDSGGDKSVASTADIPKPPSSPDTKAAATPPVSSSVLDAPGTTDKPASSPTPAQASPPKSDPAQTTGGTVPAKLKTLGFAYYGLENKEPIDLTMKIPKDKGNYTGSAAAVLLSVEGDKAEYSIARSGQLKDLLGDERVEVRPDGIYATGNTKGVLDKPSLDLPANPKTGFTWHVVSVLKTQDKTIKQDINCKVMGEVNVPDRGKTVKALLVVTTGTVTLDGVASPTVAKYWYQKGVGLIRTDLRVTQKGQKPVVMVMSRTDEGK